MSDHYFVLRRYLGFDVDLVLANDNFVRNRAAEEMFSKGWRFVEVDSENLGGVEVYTADLVDEEKPWRHSPKKTRAVLEKIFREYV